MRLAAYASVSSDEQAERGTIENQVDFGERYASLYQIGPIKWYKDDDVTGVASRLTTYKGCKGWPDRSSAYLPSGQTWT
jgi:hypothetical protein